MHRNENYSAIWTAGIGRASFTLLDYFPEDYLLFIDESHVTLPQVRAMYAETVPGNPGGIRFQAARRPDNRPLTFEEFEARQNQVIYVSATPGDYELEHSSVVVEQIISQPAWWIGDSCHACYRPD